MPKNSRICSSAPLPAARGFTLIELMIILVIMGVVVAFAGPRVAGGLMGLSTRTAALKTAAMLRYARSKALNTGCRYHVAFDGTNRKVVLLQGAREDMAGRQPMDPDYEPGLFSRNEPAVDDAVEFDADRPSETEVKTYPLPDRVFFENLAIADIDSAELDDQTVMMLTFFPSGISAGALLTIADERGRRFFITVDAISGSVRVNEEEDNA